MRIHASIKFQVINEVHQCDMSTIVLDFERELEQRAALQFSEIYWFLKAIGIFVCKVLFTPYVHLKIRL